MRKETISFVSFVWLCSCPVIAMESLAIGDWQAYAKSGDESAALGDFASAQTKFRSAIDACNVKTALPSLLVRYTNALMTEGNIKEASKELKKCLSLSKSQSGEDSQDYAESLDLQAWMYQLTGKMDDAIASLKDSIKILEVKAPGSKDLGDAYEHMGVLADTLGLFEQSEAGYSKALEIRKKLMGANSVDAADLYESLGHIALKRGQQEKGMQLFYEGLRIKESRGEPWKRYAPEPTDRVVMFHYFPGAPNCQQGTMEGVQIEKVTANGVTVEVGLSQKPSEFAKTTRALVRVHNGSQYDVDILPQRPTFIQVTPTVQILHPVDTVELASKIEKKGESKAKWIKFWGAQATSSVTSYSYNSMNGVPPVYGYVPSAFGWQAPMGGYGGAPGSYGYAGPNGYSGYGYNNNNYGRGNRFSSTSMSTVNVPDYQKRAEAYQKAAETTNKSQNEAAAVRDGALGPSLVRAGQTVEGALDFDFSKYKSAILRIPIGNSVFEFRFQ